MENLNGANAPTLPAYLQKHRYRRAEASEYLAIVHGLKIARTTLAKFATIGGGPAFRKFNASVVYDRSDLDKWVASRLSAPRTSTAA